MSVLWFLLGLISGALIVALAMFRAVRPGPPPQPIAAPPPATPAEPGRELGQLRLATQTGFEGVIASLDALRLAVERLQPPPPPAPLPPAKDPPPARIPEPIPRALETAPAVPTAPQIVELWDQAFENGTLSARFVRSTMKAMGLQVEVSAGADAGLPPGDPILLIRDQSGVTWVLPDFAGTYASVQKYFEIPATSPRTDPVARLIKPARYLANRQFERGVVG